MGIRRLSFKLILSIAIPLVAGLGIYALLLRQQIEERLIGDVVRYFLKARADEVARKLEESLSRSATDAAAWARDPQCREVLEAYAVVPRERVDALARSLSKRLEVDLRERGVYAFGALVHASGRVLASAAGSRDDGRARATLDALGGIDAAFEPWYSSAAKRRVVAAPFSDARDVVALDRRREPLLLPDELNERRFGALYAAFVQRLGGGSWLCWLESPLPEDGDAPRLERWWSGIEAAPDDLVRGFSELAVSRAPTALDAARIVEAACSSEGAWRLWGLVALDGSGRSTGPPYQGTGRNDRKLPAPSGRTWSLEASSEGRERREIDGAIVVRASDLLEEGLPGLPTALPETQDLRDYGVSFAIAIRGEGTTGSVPLGVLFLHMAWAHVQEDVLDRVAEDFKRLHEGERYESGYAFLFAADRDTIIGHRLRSNYGTRLTREHGLALLHERIAGADWGVAPYEYPPGNPKTSGFRRMAGPEQGGLGWIVGVGIDDRDTQSTVGFLGTLLLGGAVLLAVWSVITIFFVARTLTQPIRNLILFTNRLADGDLAARIPIRGNDELGRLGRAFNAMADALGRARERLIAAEKEAAWREMARQIAHEIKNPLTPLRLSAQLLPRAFREKPEHFPEILDRSVETILRSIESLRGIAADFARFAGAPSRRPERLRLGEIADEALALFKGMSDDGRIELSRRGLDGAVIGDREELRRVFINVVDNAFQALLDAGRAQGRIEVSIGEGNPDEWLVEIRDDGPGIPAEAQPRLFEPYFSTKTTGTGLGLAICRRIVREMGGEVRVGSTGPQGTVLELRLPRAPDAEV